MRGTLRAQSREYNEQRTRELREQHGSFQQAGSRPSQIPDLMRDMAKWGGTVHRGASQDGPMH